MKYNIKVLGTGCKGCHELLLRVNEALATTNQKAEYISDLGIIAEQGVMRLPALIIDDEIIACGKILTVKEIADILQNRGII